MLVLATKFAKAPQRALRDMLKARKKYGMQAVFNAMPPEARYAMACARIYLGDFSNYAGWSFRDSWAMERNFLPHGLPMWRGENVERLIVFGEQGIGDQILWASVLPECMVRCRRVVYTCDSRLIGLLQRSLPGLACTDRDWTDLVLTDFDAYIAAGDLFPLFRRRVEDFPKRSFLRCADPPVGLSAYAGRVGIGWGGRQGSLDPASLGIPFDHLVSLQHDATWPGIETPPIDLHNDMEGTLALVSSLAGVVCVPSSLHHLAGAAGCDVDIIWPQKIGKVENHVPWSHPPGKLPWYPNAHVYKTVEEWRDFSPLARAP